MPSASEIQTTWLGYLHSTGPADRPGAEAAVRKFFRAADFEEPRHFCWFGSPLSAAWALALLAEPYSAVWPMTLGAARKDRLGRLQVEQATALVCEILNVPTVEAARALLGPPLGAGLNHAPGSVSKWLQPELAVARIDLYANGPVGLYAVSPHLSILARAEEHLLGSARGVLGSDLVCSGAGQIVSSSYFGEYALASMATDQMHCGNSPPAILAAAWAIAQRSGPWWPFVHGAVLTERPSERGFISIAPDDLHKADTSGGDPYEIAVPDLRADGELLNERHSLLFVDYLRLCFRFGGFPGFDGADARPAAIDRLTADLVPF